MTDTDEVINKFIVSEEDYGKDFASKMANRILKYAKISKDGRLLLESSDLLPINKVKLLLASRFIAHAYRNEITTTVTLTDVEKLLTNESPDAVRARMSQIVQSGFAHRKGKGLYEVLPYKIEKFIDTLDYENQPLNTLEDSANKSTKKPKIKRHFTKNIGVGKDILELVNQNFFDKPRTVKEVEDKLKEEVKYHDIRVIDKAIRETFVKSKKILKRIQNTGEGKARWVYVIRQ